jgi:hypothetical protein
VADYLAEEALDMYMDYIYLGLRRYQTESEMQALEQLQVLESERQKMMRQRPGYPSEVGQETRRVRRNFQGRAWMHVQRIMVLQETEECQERE